MSKELQSWDSNYALGDKPGGGEYLHARHLGRVLSQTKKLSGHSLRDTLRPARAEFHVAIARGQRCRLSLPRR